jgi:hypothetical protein
MDSLKTEMYCEKKYELEEIKGILIEEFAKLKISDGIFRAESLRELGEVKIMLLSFERGYMRLGKDISLDIVLYEYQGSQYADIVCGQYSLVSFGAEKDFVKTGEEILKNIGFETKMTV